MVKGNSNKPSGVMAGDSDKYQRYDLTNLDNYEGDYEFPYSDKINKILEFPDTDDMAGVVERGIFKDERSLNAILRLAHRHIKFGDKQHQELLRMKVSGTTGIGGVARLDALFTAVNLIAPEMYRTARGMTRRTNKEGEEPIHRGSDFREYERPQNNNGVVSH